MGDTKKRNIFSRIFEAIKNGWNRLGEPDIDNIIDIKDAYTARELKRIQQVQAQVHEQKGFVQRAKVDEDKARNNVKEKTIMKEQKSLGLGE